MRPVTERKELSRDMQIAITGGMGFIGLALTRELIQAGHQVLLIDDLSPQIHGDVPSVTAPAGAKVVRLDVRKLHERFELLENCDVVYHLAAQTGTAQSMYRVVDYVDVNEVGTASLLEALGKCSRRRRRIILSSSRSVYGEGAYVSTSRPEETLQPLPRTKEQLASGKWEPVDAKGHPLKAIPTPESLGFSPGSVYAATKAAQELLCKAASEALGAHLTIFRFQNVYGEGQSLQNPYTGIISIFFNRARQGLDIPIYEDGLESRDFIHVNDVVFGLMAALASDTPSGAIMNLGSGEPTSVSHLAKELLSASGLSVPVKLTGQFRVGDIRHCYADLTLAKKLIGFKPRVSLAEGLKRFSSWAREQPEYENKLEAATEELRRQGLTN